MTPNDRTPEDPRRLPDNVIAFQIPAERRAQPRWIQRMQQQGLPTADWTARVTVGPKDAA